MGVSQQTDVQVTPASGRLDLKAFIHLPFRLHANHPLWIPLPKLERWVFLNRRLNAFFSHGEAEYFLARRGGRVVGRITAQINHAFNDHQKKNWGWFGFLEFEDDQEVLEALLEAAAGWLRANRPAQTACKGDLLYEAFDWRVAMRTLRRSPDCLIAVSMKVC